MNSYINIYGVTKEMNEILSMIFINNFSWTKKKNKMKKGEIYNKKSVMDNLKKYDYLAKDDDYIEVTQWYNGEGYDISMKDDVLFSLTIGQLEAINYLTKKLDYEKEEKQ